MYIEKIDNNNVSFAWSFSVNLNSCNNPQHFSDYLKFNALNDFKTGMGVTYLFMDTNNSKIAGYVSLKASSLVCEDENNIKLGYPSIEITELAVDGGHERKHIGTDILEFVVATTEELRKSIGIQYILICADPKAVGFYLNSSFGFTKTDEFSNIPREKWNKNCIPLFAKLEQL